MSNANIQVFCDQNEAENWINKNCESCKDNFCTIRKSLNKAKITFRLTVKECDTITCSKKGYINSRLNTTCANFTTVPVARSPKTRIKNTNYDPHCLTFDFFENE